MIADWLAREGWIVLSWWLLASLAGLAALPLCFSLLRALPDRGYTLARALGLLLTGFVFWLGVSLGLLGNTSGSILLAWLIVVGTALALYARRGRATDLRRWWRENRRFALIAELLFAAALLALALLRAHNNSLHGTEKPMELAFLSATQRSQVFPPADPWFSGHAISYYYFGYVLLAMMATLSGIGSTVAFNTGVALVFALGALTAFGVAGNLARSRRGRAGWRGGLLGAGFVTVIGNWQMPLVELPWQAGPGADSWFAFWGQHGRLTAQAFPPGAQIPVDLADWDFWWWFRASRVLTDRHLDGSLAPIRVITEFPAFSYLLADAHPHVLALPFVLLVTGLALCLVLSPRAPGRAMLMLCGVVVGGVMFLNAWDGPPSLLLLGGAFGLRRLLNSRGAKLTGADLLATGWFTLRLALPAVLCYFPFYLSFRNQAGGILPNLQHPSDIRQLFLVFAPLAILLGAWLLRDARRHFAALDKPLLLRVAVLLPLVLTALLLAGVLLATRLEGGAGLLQGYLQTGSDPAALPALLVRRLSAMPALFALCAGLGLVLARLLPRGDGATAPSNARPDAGAAFALLLTGAGLLLVLAPEFVFLRDVFSSRSNTVFKFYFHAWLLFSVAAAWAARALHDGAEGRARRLPAALTLLAVAPGLMYPLAGVYARAFVESGRLRADQPPPLSLDGGPGFVSPDDYAAIRCLESLVGDGQPVVAEASGPQYQHRFGRVGTLTGIPVVLNWEGHQRQWRGAAWDTLRGSRARDLERLFSGTDLQEAGDIIRRHGIDYVFWGESERNRYGTGGELKFRDAHQALCEAGNSRFYRVGDAADAVTRS